MPFRGLGNYSIVTLDYIKISKELRAANQKIRRKPYWTKLQIVLIIRPQPKKGISEQATNYSRLKLGE